MGKKKSKTAKKKQSAMAAAVATKRFGGVTAKKGGGRERASSSSSSTILVSVKSVVGNKIGSHANKPSSGTTTTTTPRTKSTMALTTTTASAAASDMTSKTKEKNDFDREMQSLQERKAAEWRKPRTLTVATATTTATGSMSSSKKNRKNRMRTIKSNNNKHGFEFAQPTFAVDDHEKSTHQLMEETVHRVGVMKGIQDHDDKGGDGGGSSHRHRPRPKSSLQVAMTQQRIASYWTPPPSKSLRTAGGVDGGGKNQGMSDCSNPYAVLEMADEDEGVHDGVSAASTFVGNQYQKQSDSPSKPFLTFAPASFSVGGSTPPLDDDYVDPDL